MRKPCERSTMARVSERRRLLLAALLVSTGWADAAPAATAAETLSARLLASHSATAVLQAICDARTPGEKIAAIKSQREASRQATAAARADLGVGPREPLSYRRVELTCGGKVLSRAENWYLPARLTAQMNAALATTSTPFGAVVTPLNYHRRTLSVAYLSGWPNVLRHRAVLETPDGRPFSRVVETYPVRAVR